MDAGLVLRKLGLDIIGVGVFISGGVSDDLCGTERIVVRISISNRLLQKGCGIVTDDDSCIKMFIVNCLTYSKRIVVVVCRCSNDPF